MHPSSTLDQTSSGAPAQPPVPATPRRGLPALRRRAQLARKLAADVGQGTVEYVGLLLLMATVLAGVVAVSEQLKGKEQIGEKVVKTIGKSIDTASEPKR